MKNDSVKVPFRASPVSRAESSAVRFVHWSFSYWTCQIGRASQFVGGPAAVCVSWALVWCDCCAPACAVVSFPLVGAAWLWPVCGGSLVCCVGVRACC